MFQEGFHTTPADKDIQSGIQAVINLMAAKQGWKLRIFSTCVHTISEFSTYKWLEKKWGDSRDEKPPKTQDDHCMDSIRYFVKQVAQPTAAKSFGRVRTRF
jgi:phage terminase large subunit